MKIIFNRFIDDILKSHYIRYTLIYALISILLLIIGDFSKTIMLSLIPIYVYLLQIFIAASTILFLVSYIIHKCTYFDFLISLSDTILEGFGLMLMILIFFLFSQNEETSKIIVFIMCTTLFMFAIRFFISILKIRKEELTCI